jgi:hypothetical protein
MSDPPARKVHQGEVLPPERMREPSLPSLPAGSPFGIPMLARAKFEAHARAFRAYIDLRVAQRTLIEVDTSIVGAAQDRLAAEEHLARALQRQRHLDKILLADEAKLLAELDEVFESIAGNIADKQELREDHALERRITRANLEAEAFEAEARLERIRNPPAAKSDPDENLSPAKRAAREIARVKQDNAELRAELIAAAGGEDNLTEDDRAHLDTLALSEENQIRLIMENL